MSTTPSTSSRLRVSYTVVGGGQRPRRDGPAVLLLARGGRFHREDLLQELCAQAQVLSVEGPSPAYDVEQLARRFPAARFLLLRQPATPGEKVNLGMEEAGGEQVMVLWSDMREEGPGPAAGQRASAPAAGGELLCQVPRLKGPRGEVLPSIRVPAWIKGRLQVLAWKPVQEGMRTLLPFDYCGLYSRQRFLRLGGYDPRMSNPYWQKLDFGFRAALWGETIAWNPRWQLAYTAEPEGEDSTPDPGYKLFFLKNLAVRFTGDSGLLPFSRFPRYALRSGSGLLESLKEFREVRAWVHQNRFRFQADLPGLLARWDIPE